MIRIIFMVCFVLLVPVLYVMLRNETKMKKNIVLGVTLPYEAREDPTVIAICGHYRKWLAAVCWILLLPQMAFYFIPSTAVFTLVYMTWIVVIVILPYIPFLYYHRQLKIYKEEKGWASSLRGSMVVDLKSAAENRRNLSALWFLPPVILSIIPVVVEAVNGPMDSWAFVLLYLLLALMVASFYLFYRIINRQRGDVVEDNAALNRALTRIRRYNWSKMWLWMAWLTGGFNFCLWLLMDRPRDLIIMITLYFLLSVLAALQTEFAARKAQYKLTAESGRGSYVDDDQYWPHGIFYYNPNDKHLMINNRTGIGTTINTGRTAGKVLMAAAALLIALLPLTGVWMVMLERTPLTIEIIRHEIVASHTGAYHVDLGDIRDVELLDTLPQGSIRLVGTGMENLCKGRYRVPGIGQCELNLDPGVGPLLLLRTDKKVYLFGTRNPDETLAAYHALQEMYSRLK